MIGKMRGVLVGAGCVLTVTLLTNGRRAAAATPTVTRWTRFSRLRRGAKNNPEG
jgi:hypothetical protein